MALVPVAAAAVGIGGKLVYDWATGAENTRNKERETDQELAALRLYNERRKMEIKKELESRKMDIEEKRLENEREQMKVWSDALATVVKLVVAEHDATEEIRKKRKKKRKRCVVM